MIEALKAAIASMEAQKAQGREAFAADLPFEQRAAVQAQLVSDYGFRSVDTRLPEGTGLLQSGVEAQRAMKEQLNKLSLALPGLVYYKSVLQAENTVDFKTHISKFKYVEGGGLSIEGRPTPYALTKPALSQWLSLAGAPSGAGTVVATLSEKARAVAVNDWMENAQRSDDGNVVARAFTNPQGRQLVRAFTSPRHSLSRGDDIILCDGLGNMPDIIKHARLRVTREMARSELEFIWPSLDRQLFVGDIAYISLSIVNSETKQGALRVVPRLLRVLCWNFTTAFMDGEDEEISLRHVGDLRFKLPNAVANAMRKVEPFVKAFGDAYRQPLGEMTRGEFLQRVGKAYKLSTGVLDSAGKLWDADGTKSAGNTLAGGVNALTRASQELSMAASMEVERAAGMLVRRGLASLS